MPPRLADSDATFHIFMGASTPFPSPAAIARAELLTRERFVYEGETLEDALAPGLRAPPRARRRARRGRGGRQAAVDRVAAEFSLLLGLERLLSEDEPHLADGTVLSAHQVDALSGTLTALLAEAQRNGNGSASNGAAPPAEPAPARLARRSPGEDDEDEDEGDDELEEEDEDEEPQDWQDDGDEDAARGAARGPQRRPSASGSSTRPAPARRSPRSGSSRRRAPAAS